jgi:Domain of unknown function (DUF6458)
MKASLQADDSTGAVSHRPSLTRPPTRGIQMTVGTSMFLIAVGAILRYAVTSRVSGIDLRTAGTILLVAGIVGLVISLFLTASGRSQGVSSSATGDGS